MTAYPPRVGDGEPGPGDFSPGPSSSPSAPVSASPPVSSPPASSRVGDQGSSAALADELRPAARALFGDRLPLAIRYAEILATDGVERGLIGPREAPRLWERHLLNCAVVEELIPARSSVIDVGSGAGLPGIVLSVARPDLSVVLVEPLARRTAFLAEVVTELGLTPTVTVVRGRAEDVVGSPSLILPADIVTARAVAPLDRLAGWCLPLTAVGGRLLALKGATAAEEVAEHRDAVGRLGGATPVVRRCGGTLLDPPTTVVEIVRERDVVPGRLRSAKPAAGRDSRSGSGRAAGQRRTRRD